MGLLEPDAEDEPHLAPDEEVDFATKELGEPEAVFRAGGRWGRVKVIVGVLLVAYGLVANYLWWVHGPARFGHWEFHFLFGPPILGGGLLWFIYRHRGLRIALFPTGMLRITPNEVESYPWDAIETVRLRADAAEPQYLWSSEGELTACWLPLTVPMIQVWNAWFEIEGAHVPKTRFTPAVADYPDLAERVQCGTFAVLWPRVLEALNKGEPFAFGELSATAEGLRQGGKLLPWSEVKEITVAHKMVTFKKAGSWRTWWLKEISQIPNLHLLFGLLAVMGPKKAEGSEEPEENQETAVS
jgi:hypothetical protein